MHVMLDARAILAPKTGDRTYWLNLARTLPAVAPEARFTLALDGEPEPGLLPDLPNLDWRVATRPRGRAWNLLALPRLATESGVDLVHLQYVAPPWLPAPFVTTIHDCSFELFPATFGRFDGAWLRTLAPLTSRRAAGVIGVSETTRRDLLRLYRLPPGQVAGIPNGIGQEYRPATAKAVAAVRARYQLPERYLLSVGVVQPRKNLPCLLEALAIARREHGLAVPLVVVGKSGWLFGPVFELAERLGLGELVRFIGYVPDADLPPLYTGAALFCYPSWYEGFGLPPLEAGACGVAVCVSTTPALVEVTGDAAVHLPPDRPDRWAAAIAALLADEPRRERLAAALGRRAARFTWERSAHLHLLRYQAALTAAGRGPAAATVAADVPLTDSAGVRR